LTEHFPGGHGSADLSIPDHRRGRAFIPKEASMARYVVRFMKDVLGENGHEAEICQRSMEVDAADKLHASDLAKIRFCENESVREWSLHADRVHITEAELPS
jgi:hypothetical protein